jgi:ABC-type transporter Mla MlaB component
MTRTVSYIDNDTMSLILSDSVSFSILDSLIEEIKKIYSNNVKVFNSIILDFSQIKYIDSEGALALISFCSAIKRKNKNVNFYFVYPTDSVLNYLNVLGFFGQMSNKAGVKDIQDIVHYENELSHERRIRQKKYSNQNSLKSIILPIETISQQMDSISGSDFENMVGTFVNNVIDSFAELFKSPHYNFNGEDQHDFLLSNVELFKNIFEHSKSWGIASIHARPNYGTTVCYYDLGIGFKASVAKFDSELESIEWALIDGNSSKLGDDNDGFGLTIVQDFVLKRNGKIKIRSGNCLLQINSTSKQKIKVTKFPGVQISYFIPI